MESKNFPKIDRTEPLEENHEDLRKLYFSNIKKDVTADELKQWIVEQVPTLTVDNIITVDLPESKNDKPIKIAFMTVDSTLHCDEIVAAISKLKDDDAKFKGNTVNMKRAVPKNLNLAEQSFRIRTDKLFLANVQKTGDIQKELMDYIYSFAPDCKDEESRGPGEVCGPLGGIKKITIIKEKEEGGGFKINENKGYGFIECETCDLADRLAIQFFQFSWSTGGVDKRTVQLKKSMKDGDQGVPGKRGRGGMRGGQMRGGPRGGQRGGYGGYGQQQAYGGYGGGYGAGYDAYGAGYGGYAQQAYGGGYGGGYGQGW